MKQLWMASSVLFIFPALTQATVSYYAGISGGANQNAAKITFANAFSDTTSFSAGPNTDANTDNLSGLGQIQLGAGMSDKWFYLGFEAVGQLFSGQFDSVQTSNVQTNLSPTQTITLNDDVKLHLNDFEFAIDLKSGVYVYAKTLLYARGGIGFNQMELRQTSIVNNVTNNITFNSNSSESKDVYPWRVGLGLERHMTTHCSIVMDYIYTQYNDISTTGHGSGSGFTLDSNSKASDISEADCHARLKLLFIRK